MVWYGVVWCAAIVSLQDWAVPRAHQLCAGGHDVLLCVPSCFACCSPAPIRSFVRIRMAVRCESEVEKFRTGEILGGMHGLT